MSKTISLFTLLSLQLAFPVASALASEPLPDALSLLNQGKVDEAIALTEQKTKAAPKDWTAHAMLSYLQWQTGNVQDAVSEGQKAIFNAPNNAIPIINLAHIYQSLGQYTQAIPLYEKAAKLDQTDWVSRISLARSMFGKDDLSGGKQILDKMAATNSNDFAWSYQLGISYLTIDEPSAAVAPLELALKKAPTEAQRDAARSQLLIAYLRDSQNEKAKQLLPAFLASTESNGETFVRVLEQFPDLKVFECAAQRLTNTKDNEQFFRMGRSLYGKQVFELAEKCFRQAIELDPGVAKNHLALAAVLDATHRSDLAMAELEQASMFDASDPIAKFLQEHQTDKSIVGVRFKAEGLTCGCQSTRIDAAIRSVPGVALIGFEHKVPYEGTMFVDITKTPLETVFAETKAKTFPAGGESVPPNFKLITVNQNTYNSVADAADVALQAAYGSPTKFHHTFEPIAPSLPEAPMLSSRGTGL